MKKACALIREVESACVTVVRDGGEAESDGGGGASGVRDTRRRDDDVRSVVRAFYTRAKKGKGATSPSHATVRTYTDVIAALRRCAAPVEALDRSGEDDVEPGGGDVDVRATPAGCLGAARRPPRA